MAQFMPVAPIQVLEGLYEAGLFGDGHLLLAHHTVAYKKRFKELFQRAYDDGWSGTIIMDNSIVELGDAVNFDMVAEASALVYHTDNMDVYPVLPDVMGNGYQTREATLEAYPLWAKEMPGTGLMAVCQGIDFQDYLTSLRLFGHMEEFTRISMLGVPRILTKLIGSRMRPALSAREYLPTHRIHLLGFSDSIVDDIDSAKCVGQCSIDSAVPLRVREVFTEFLDAGKRPADWFDRAQVDQRMAENLKIARELFQ